MARREAENEMKITKTQLRKIIKEELLKEALPPHLQKHFRKGGSSVYEPQVKDVTPAGYGPEDGEDDGSSGIGEMMLKVLYDQFGVRGEEASGFLRMVADRLEGE